MGAIWRTIKQALDYLNQGSPALFRKTLINNEIRLKERLCVNVFLDKHGINYRIPGFILGPPENFNNLIHNESLTDLDDYKSPTSERDKIGHKEITLRFPENDIKLEIENSDEVIEDLKNRAIERIIRTKENENKDLRLFYSGRPLSPQNKLKEYSIKSGNVITSFFV